MSIQSIPDLLPAYVAGELAEADRVRVEAAVAASPRLQADLARYQQLFVLLAAAALAEEEAPPGLEGQIIRRVAVEWYLTAAASLLDDLLRSYGRALVYYLGLA